MFTARIDFTDIVSPFHIDGEGIFFGSSFVIPYKHRVLASTIVESPNRTAIVNFERYADDCQDTNHWIVEDDQQFRQRLAWLDAHLLDWAVLTIEKFDKRVEYSTSLIHSAPVYIISDSKLVELDWNYSKLLRDKPIEIDWSETLAHLAGVASYVPQTLLKGLYRSLPGCVIYADIDGVRATPPPLYQVPGPGRLSPEASPGELFYDTVKALIAARPLERTTTAVEMSGGMDSAVVALAAADVLGPGVLSCGAQLNGEMGAAQRSRRELIRSQGEFDDIVLPANRFLPFRKDSARRIRLGVWPQDENYPELFDAIGAVLQAAGVDVLLSGYGGDELYAAYTDEEPDGTELSDKQTGFLTETGMALAQASATAFAQGALQDTSWLSAAARSQRLLCRGIWPVHPYNSVELSHFIASLPWSYRRDRAVLRDTLTAKLGNSVYSKSYTKESFRETALLGVMDNKNDLVEMLDRCPLMNDLYIRTGDVRQTLMQVSAELSRDKFNSLFSFLATAGFF